jgi:branched-subunit amino acid aminotransferase/4-amino-4-deoxychorismate lyase
MPLQAFPEELADKGIALMTYHYQRPLPQVKTIDYTIGILLLPQAKQNGFDEILFVQDGKVSESPRSNVFAVTREGVLITPKGNVLNGITRMRLLHHAKAIMPVEELDISLQELCDASEVWISSTTKGIWPVRQIDEHIIGIGTTGPVARQLYGLLLKEMGE